MPKKSAAKRLVDEKECKAHGWTGEDRMEKLRRYRISGTHQAKHTKPRDNRHAKTFTRRMDDLLFDSLGINGTEKEKTKKLEDHCISLTLDKGKGFSRRRGFRVVDRSSEEVKTKRQRLVLYRFKLSDGSRCVFKNFLTHGKSSLFEKAEKRSQDKDYIPKPTSASWDKIPDNDILELLLSDWA